MSNQKTDVYWSYAQFMVDLAEEDHTVLYENEDNWQDEADQGYPLYDLGVWVGIEEDTDDFYAHLTILMSLLSSLLKICSLNMR